MHFGLLSLPWWGYVLVTLGLTHVTIASVTIYLHRHQAHRAIDLHPIASHFLRSWLWLTTGMMTKEWVAIHRKHHAKCETPEDPHSPQFYGIRRVLLEGAELYRSEAKNVETLERYGHGTPDDWAERNLYSKHVGLGIGFMLAIDLVLFGLIGLSIWAVQMLWVPLFAAGVINGIGHYWGYRTYAPNDASTNIVPWGILIGGEELHNNHHAYVSSARLSSKWWELDLGWVYIRLLVILRLAKVRRVAPKIRFKPAREGCDARMLQVITTHRYHVLALFANSLQKTALDEACTLRTGALRGLNEAETKKALEHWLQRETRALPARERAIVQPALHASALLRNISAMRHDLTTLWSRSATSEEQRVKQLEDWCHRADQSGIRALQEFSAKLRCYA
ncbi:fatty acid desaturase [Cupriavidus taiwanensis]|uniref:DesA family fatty acid desaturase n=1 Tax=Cupriavidus taiwanensis TaxID=164546 RepID=UPI0039C14FE2